MIRKRSQILNRTLLGLVLCISTAQGQTYSATANGVSAPTPLPDSAPGEHASDSLTPKPTVPPNAFERSPSSTQRLSKEEILARLRELKARQVQAVNSLDELIRKRLNDSATLDLKGVDTNLARQRVSRLGMSIEELTRRRSDFSARREFVDQLILQFDMKWNSQPLKTFLEQQLLEMANTDLSDARNPGRLWKFLTYLSITVREVSDPREDMLALVEGYMNFGGVNDPGNPADFLASRNYTNGSISTTANPGDREKVGEYLEQRMKELGIVENASQKVELRTQLPAPKQPSETK